MYNRWRFYVLTKSGQESGSGLGGSYCLFTSRIGHFELFAPGGLFLMPRIQRTQLKRPWVVKCRTVKLELFLNGL